LTTVKKSLNLGTQYILRLVHLKAGLSRFGPVGCLTESALHLLCSNAVMQMNYVMYWQSRCRARRSSGRAKTRQPGRELIVLNSYFCPCFLPAYHSHNREELHLPASLTLFAMMELSVLIV